MVGGLGDRQGSKHIDKGLALGDQLLIGFELADDLLGWVTGSFHNGDPGPVWPEEDSHSPCTDFQGPRQKNCQLSDKGN